MANAIPVHGTAKEETKPVPKKVAPKKAVKSDEPRPTHYNGIEDKRGPDAPRLEANQRLLPDGVTVSTSNRWLEENA